MTEFNNHGGPVHDVEFHPHEFLLASGEKKLECFCFKENMFHLSCASLFQYSPFYLHRLIQSQFTYKLNRSQLFFLIQVHKIERSTFGTWRRSIWFRLLKKTPDRSGTTLVTSSYLLTFVDFANP